MPRKYMRKLGAKPRAVWTEDALKAAFEELRQNQCPVNEISRRYGIPSRNLRRRFENKDTQKLTLGKHPILNFDNEKRLVTHIRKLEAAGFPVTRDMLRRLAFEFAEKLGVQHNFDQESRRAGHHWLRSFMERHTELSVRQTEGLSLARAQGLNRDPINKKTKGKATPNIPCKSSKQPRQVTKKRAKAASDEINGSLDDSFKEKETSPATKNKKSRGKTTLNLSSKNNRQKNKKRRARAASDEIDGSLTCDSDDSFKENEPDFDHLWSKSGSFSAAAAEINRNKERDKRSNRIKRPVRIAEKQIYKDFNKSDEEKLASDSSTDATNECVECFEDFEKTKLNVDWIQCVICKKWLHETCTMYGDYCNQCQRLKLRHEKKKQKFNK